MEGKLIPFMAIKKTVSLFCLILLLFAIKNGYSQDIVLNQNGSFESSDLTNRADTADIEGWSIATGDGASADFAIVGDTVKDGNRAMKITVNAAGSNPWSIQVANEPFPVKPGITYRFSVWAKSSGGGTANFTAGNPSFDEFGRIGNSDVSLTQQWQEFTFTFQPGSGDTMGRAPIHLSFAANNGKSIWIDSLRITTPNTKPIVVEAESGTLDANWSTRADNDITYITTDGNLVDSNFPGTNRIAKYTVTFPDTGSYDLFARVYVPEKNPANHDSFFQSVGFGNKDPGSVNDWYIVNGLGTAGFMQNDAVVGGPGAIGGGIWKWVNLSRNAFQGDSAGPRILVSRDSLTQTIEIGAREDSIRIDKFALGLSQLYFTVANLDNGTAGSIKDPSVAPVAMDPIAKGKTKWLGNIYSASQLPEFNNYWNQVTPENAGKWGTVESTRGQYNWDALDTSYKLAKDNSYPFMFHTLIWGNQQPAWLKGLSKDEQLNEIKAWFTAVADRYPDIDYLQVVNEPLHEPPTEQADDPGSGGYYEALGGAGETGWDWVINAFQMARDIFPKGTKLMINDYNIMNSQSNASKYIKLIKLLKERGLVDRIGIQAHAFSNGSYPPNSSVTPASQKVILDSLYDETGLRIVVTEMDIDGLKTGTEQQSQEYQLSSYQKIFPVYWEHPAVEGITLWGWRPGLWRNDEEAYIMNNDNQPRLALNWLRSYVDSAKVYLYNENIDKYNPIAKNKSKWLGCAYSNAQSPSFLNYWNQVTPENAGKWGSVEGTRDQYNWTQLDEAYNVAKTNRLPFTFHVLIWGAQQPSWINTLPPEEQLKEIKQWFEAVANRYPHIDYLQVVNEPLHQRPDGTSGEADYEDALGGPGDTGWDWVIKAFQMAKDIFPKGTKLMINDYGIVNDHNAVRQYLNIINLLKDRGLIDVIGVQAHAFNNGGSSTSSTTPATIKSNLDELAKTGIPIQATEVDIDGDPNGDVRESQDVQLERYKKIFPVFWENPAVKGVTLWGWRPGMWRSNQDAYLWDDYYNLSRPALTWLRDYVDKTDLNVGIEDLKPVIATQFGLGQNYPNPFNPTTNITYKIPQASNVRINIYDITGRLVQTLLNEHQSAGEHTITFSARSLASGVYFYELRAGTFSKVKKMILIK